MEISSSQHQIMASHQLEELMDQNHQNNNNNNNIQEKKPVVSPHPHPPELALRCPRCNSPNTKFCYYNNYSLSQPRYFCKGCRRYWTQGGSLRNVPVGGGCRKNHHSKKPSTKNKPNPNPMNPLISNLPPVPLSYYDPAAPSFLLGSYPNPNPSPIGLGFLEILRSGFLDNSANIDPPGININNNFCSYGGDHEGERKVVMDHNQWHFGNNEESVATVDNSARGYSWNTNGDGSYCYGLINRSLM